MVVLAGLQNDRCRNLAAHWLADICRLEHGQVQAQVAPAQGDLIVRCHVQIGFDGEGDAIGDMPGADAVLAQFPGQDNGCQRLVFLLVVMQGRATGAIEFDPYR
ncbi:hypothetical protein D3C86_1593670 [compost metagenome]